MALRLEEISVSKILPNPYQVRKTFDTEKIAELAESIKATGQVVPVTATETKGGFLLVAGERRLRAARKAGEKSILAAIMDIPKKHLRLRALQENLARVDLPEKEKRVKVLEELEKGRNPKTDGTWTAVALSKALAQHNKFVQSLKESRTVERLVPEALDLPPATQSRLHSLANPDPRFGKGKDVDAARTIAKAIGGGRVGHDPATVASAIHIVPKLAPPARKALAEGKIGLDRAADLATMKPAQQKELLEDIVASRKRALVHEDAHVEHRKAQASGKREPSRSEIDEEAEALAHFEDVRWKVHTLSAEGVEGLSERGRKEAVRLLRDIYSHLRSILKDVGALKEIE